MPTVDLDDGDIQLLDAIKKAGGLPVLDNWARAFNLHSKLMGRETRRTYEDTIKKVFPDAPTSSDIAEPYMEEVRGISKRLDEYITNQEKERADAAAAKEQADFSSSWGKVKTDYSLTEEGEKAVFDHMKARKIYDPEAGALSYFKHNPKAPEPVKPEALTPQGWGLTRPGPGETEDDMKLLIADPDGWAEREAAAVMNEQRQAA